jgi:hypothetical protein
MGDLLQSQAAKSTMEEPTLNTADGELSQFVGDAVLPTCNIG